MYRDPLNPDKSSIISSEKEKSIFLFNPENDLALANFASNYTPPASAVRMARELALLPIWYADPDEQPFVIAEGEEHRTHLQWVQEVLGVKATLISYEELASFPHHRIVPWGWSPSLVRKLRSHGAAEEQLASEDQLERLRDYSNRRHAVEILSDLRSPNTGFIGESRFFTGVDKLLTYLNSFSGDKVLKMPLSGSGKGLIWILGRITDKQTDWARKVIRDQGGVVAEPVYTRARDFAMEFYLDRGAVRFAGYSLFRTAASGTYMGNELLSDERIVELLSGFTSPDLLHRLQERWEMELARRFPHYQGYAGVDMMVCDSAEGFKIHPCVEINVRMNMGVASRRFHEHHVQPGREGRFVVDYFKKPEGALSFHHTMKQEHPLVVENKKVASGYLPLTPVTANTHYIAYAIVEDKPVALHSL